MWKRFLGRKRSRLAAAVHEEDPDVQWGFYGFQARPAVTLRERMPAAAPGYFWRISEQLGVAVGERPHEDTFLVLEIVSLATGEVVDSRWGNIIHAYFYVAVDEGRLYSSSYDRDGELRDRVIDPLLAWAAGKTKLLSEDSGPSMVIDSRPATLTLESSVPVDTDGWETYGLPAAPVPEVHRCLPDPPAGHFWEVGTRSGDEIGHAPSTGVFLQTALVSAVTGQTVESRTVDILEAVKWVNWMHGSSPRKALTGEHVKVVAPMVAWAEEMVLKMAGPSSRTLIRS